MKKVKFFFLFCCFLTVLAFPGPSQGSMIFPDGESHQARWAEPIAVEGVPNLYRFGPGLYRGGQPTRNGFEKLQKLGIKTIVNLRSFYSDEEEAGKLAISYEQIPMKAWHAEKGDIVRFLRMATDPRRLSIFVHCLHGADRTGLIVAAYRVAVTGWTKDRAIWEMVEGGYGFHSIWANLVYYLRDLDVDAIRKEAGIINQTPVTLAPSSPISSTSN